MMQILYLQTDHELEPCGKKPRLELTLDPVLGFFQMTPNHPSGLSEYL